jgi:hypothetical protein
MPIQRQSESFGYFDDGPRFARDRSSTELPAGLAGLINSSGPRITGGLLNTRQAAWGDSDPDLPPRLREVGIMPGGGLPRSQDDSCDYCGQPGHDWQVHPEAWADVAVWNHEKKQNDFPFGDHVEGEYPADDDHGGEAWPGRSARVAVNVDGMDPESHAYHTELPPGPGPGREWNPDFGYEPSDEDERRSEGVYDDDDSGYNWGPEPTHLHAEDVYHSPTAEPFDTPIHNPRSSPYDNITGSRHPFDRTAGRRFVAFDWKPDPERDEGDDEISNTHTAPLENGHALQVWQWGAQYRDPDSHEFYSPEEINNPKHQQWDCQIYTPTKEDPEYAVYHKGGFASKEEAMSHSQEQYEKMFPVGINTGGHDSGVDYSDLNSYMKHLESMRRRTAACQLCGGPVFHISGEGFVHHDDDDHQGWEIDEDHRAEPDDEDDHNLGLSSLEGWHGRHGQLRTARGGGHEVPWEESEDGWHHPATNISVRPSQDVPGHWQMWSPATTKSRDKPAEAKIHEPNPDPQALMDWHDYQQGGPAPDWHERPRRIWDNMFPPNKLGGALAAPPVPGASAYQPAHRVGLPWRDQVIPGTVIGLDGPHVAVRWDDGQYSSEEPHNIHLL